MANFAPNNIVTLLRLCGKTTNINYKTMKKLKALLIAVQMACSIGCFAQSTENPFSFIKFSDHHFFTASLVNEEMGFGELINDSTTRVAGYFTIMMKLSAKNAPAFEMPDSPTMTYMLVDAYNDSTVFLNQDMTSFLKTCKYSKVNRTIGSTRYIGKGGHYAACIELPFADYKYTKEFDITDAPSIRYIYEKRTGVGTPFVFTSYYNTGYPYDINSLTGEEWAKYTIYSLSDSNDPIEIASGKKQLALKDTSKPLLAVVDSLTGQADNLPIGKYLLTLESNWNDMNRELNFEVTDTLRATIRIDKSEYSTDDSIRIDATLDYGFPYIDVVEETNKPTVFFSYELENADGSIMILTNDTIVNEAYANGLHNESLRLSLPLGSCNTDNLSDGDNECQLTIKVIFNTAIQFQKVFPVTIRKSATGVETVTKGETEDEEWSSLGGVRIAKPTKKGLYIRNNKKVVVQ